MRSLYDQELRDIHRDSIQINNTAFESFQDAMEVVRRGDFTRIDRVQEQDRLIRVSRVNLNERVLRMIATQHPVAVDLRKLFYLIHTADEMTRISYQAVAICQAILDTQYGKVILLEDLYRMSERVALMFEKMHSATRGDVEPMVETVIKSDDEVDVLYEQIIRECLARREGEQDRGRDVMTAYSIAKYIEHAGDHIVNWGRWWLFFNKPYEEDNPPILV